MTPLEAKRKKFPGAIGVAAFHGIWRVANGEFAAGRIGAARVRQIPATPCQLSAPSATS